MNRNFYFSVCILLVGVFSLQSQAQKVEKERRISLEKFPATSLKMLDLEFSGRTHQKLYLETGSSGTTYESKFTFGQQKYSVKFFENGQWMDTEKEVPEDGLLPSVKNNIHASLRSDFSFDKFRLIRIQEQTSKEGLRYEIEIKGKSRGITELFEFLFDGDGTYIRHQVIVIDSYSNEF